MFSPQKIWRRAVSAPILSPAGVFRALILWPLAVIYRLGSILHRALAKSSQCSRRAVVSVGNITVGGSGKTPLVGWLAAKLNECGYRVGIVCSGYGRQSAKPVLEFGAALVRLPPYEIGDEPLLLAAQTPHALFAVDADKKRGVKALDKTGEVDVIIIDDGFQTYCVQRDLDIVAFNAGAPSEELRWFPAGLLREPLRALRRADLIVLTNDEPGNDELPKRLNRYAPENSAADTVFHSYVEYSLESVTGQGSNPLSEPALLFCGLADPRGFVEAATGLSVRPAGIIEFPDHFAYDEPTVAGICHRAEQAQATWLVTTEKDWVKLRDFNWPLPVALVKQTIHIKNSERALVRIESVIKSKSIER